MQMAAQVAKPPKGDDDKGSRSSVSIPDTPTFKSQDVSVAFDLDNLSPKRQQSGGRLSQVGGIGEAAMVTKVVRKLRDNKVTVDVEKQGEFGADPIGLLNVEREQRIGEETMELGEYFSLKSEMRKNAGGFRPSTMSSKEIMGLMMQAKPKTAAGRNQAGAFVTKAKGSKWGKVQAGVRGEVEPPPTALTTSEPETSPPVPVPLPQISGSEIGSQLTSSLASLSSIKRGALSASRSILRTPSPDKKASRESRKVSSAAASVKKPNRIKFSIDEGVKTSRLQLIRGGKPSTAPTTASTRKQFSWLESNMRLSKSAKEKSKDDGRAADSILKEIEEASEDFREVAESPSMINMDAFKAAFHQEGAEEREREREKSGLEGGIDGSGGLHAVLEDVSEGKSKSAKKKKKRTTMLFGAGGSMSIKSIRDKVSRRVSKIGMAAARAVTPPKERSIFGRGKKKYVVSSKSGALTDGQILEDSLKYWLKVKEGGMLKDVKDSHYDQKFSAGSNAESSRKSYMFSRQREKAKSGQEETYR